MLRHKIPLFIVASLLSFAAFTGIALFIQATGLIRVPSRNGSAEQAWQALGIDDYRIEIQRFAAPLLFIPNTSTTLSWRVIYFQQGA